MALEVKDIQYLDEKFERVYTKIDDNKDKAKKDVENHVKNEHRGKIGNTIIVMSALIVGISCLLTLLVIYLRGAI